PLYELQVRTAENSFRYSVIIFLTDFNPIGSEFIFCGCIKWASAASSRIVQSVFDIDDSFCFYKLTIKETLKFFGFYTPSDNPIIIKTPVFLTFILSFMIFI
ncbi:MAG: hypothetical protein LBI60_06880, partial [Bacteroidales bacterium]|nr:hypothetical protein [Bacteroidales bacterium]